MTAIDLLRSFHISAGVIALMSFFWPMILPKGGPAHRRIGWVFVTAMMGLCASAGPLSIYRLATEQSRNGLIGAAFLLYITILSFASVWNGIRVLRFKGTGRHANPADLAVSSALALGGLVTIAMGAFFRAPLLMIFGLVGAISGANDLRYWLNPEKERMHWWFQHMGGMIGASIAALTAFAVLNARRLGLDGFSVVAWVLPGLIFAPIAIAMGRHYRRRFGREGGKDWKASRPQIRTLEEAA